MKPSSLLFVMALFLAVAGCATPPPPVAKEKPDAEKVHDEWMISGGLKPRDMSAEEFAQRRAVYIERDKASEAKREETIKQLPGLTDEQREMVRKEQVWVGMPANALVVAWGYPKSRTTSGGVGGSYEIWHYYSRSCYLRNNVLVRWVVEN